ncbi:hypothetical protein [Rossellomorea aquimaris]|uniref:Uncharacterized protein n=1 Tax=Rossellomorea aquimaris TaxID=189382 RepID=A0A5D4TQD3_9BACI|nr:hypothetical protein [Rossellomorea aquimaris]TYS76414.1 hypothetical protein FZD05_17425 [Rossellomorea aquimaris]TYS83004.1 hypothetical protein FZC85_18025 [Rossellomorea aquimaris]
MKNFISEFQAALSNNAKWEVSQQYSGQLWELRKIGIAASFESEGGQFWITDMYLDGYGEIQIASVEIPASEINGYSNFIVEPPRTFEDLEDGQCPLFCYVN